MSENILENITGIELGSMTMDDGMPSTVLTIKTKKSNYVFRLSESFPTEKQINIFRAMVMDLQSDMVEEKRKEISETEKKMTDEEVKKPVEKHDGARLFDEPPSAPTDVEITVKPVATQD